MMPSTSVHPTNHHKSTSLKQQAKAELGQLFLMGFEGLELAKGTRHFLDLNQIGGVLLFSRNYENPLQVAKLIREVQATRSSSLPLWVSVDHEGGSIQRFQTGFTRIPSAHLIGQTGSPKIAFQIAEIMAQELRAVGINLNFSPVVDIHTEPKNPVIGERAFGNTPEAVGSMITAVIRGHLTHHVQPCMKHFPGHGDTLQDSHFFLPQVATSAEILRTRELVPFQKAIHARCPFLMTAHIQVPALDPEHPATFSSLILKNLLRQELGYSQIIISDDLEMKAIADHYHPAEIPRLALEAGCDLLCYRSEAACGAALESLKQDLEQDRLDPQVVLTAAQRLKTLKQAVLLPHQPTEMQRIAECVGIPAHTEKIQALLQGR